MGRAAPDNDLVSAVPTTASRPPYLVADIGASNARFCQAGPDGLVGETLILPTPDYTSVDALLRDALQRLGAAPAATCFAIAGPVDGAGGRLTNGTLEFDGEVAAQVVGCPVLLVNDFFALARSLPELRELEQLGGTAPPEAAVRAVLGPGSGLGMSLLVPEGAGWRVLPSEGGHADLAAGNPLEAELLTSLQMAHGHVSWETVLSGPGLVRLYGAVCQLWGVQPEEVGADWITANGVQAAEPICHQTLEIFCGLLGAAAGNLAVTTWAVGGVYLGGGILPRMAEFLPTSPLRRRFEERGPMTERFRAVPLYLIRDPAAGLRGALGCLTDRQPA